ncbi:MAG: 3-phosphoshikimate 1-carboxyvinyltransferase [Calditrichia bacterium]
MLKTPNPADSRSIEIQPGIIRGFLNVPPSKSITHRLMVMAALSSAKCRIIQPLNSEDTRLTLQGLQQMGYEAKWETNVLIFSGKYSPPASPVILQAGNSGTTARLLTAVAALRQYSVRIEGSERLHQRPAAPLTAALRKLGAEISDTAGHYPLQIRKGVQRGGTVKVDASQSSQFLSALYLIAPLLPEGLKIIPEGKVVSRPYTELTLALMTKHGIRLKQTGRIADIPGGQAYGSIEMVVEGDYSSAAFFICGAALSGGEITIGNLPRHSVQGDKKIIEIIRAAGGQADFGSGGLSIRGGSLHGVEPDMADIPDLVPPTAVMLLFAKGSSCLKNVAHLRHKESDRLLALQENIRRLGANAEIRGNDFFIFPGAMKGCKLPSYGDHRIAMSFALAGLKIPGILIEEPECVAKSYPDFWQHLQDTR